MINREGGSARSKAGEYRIQPDLNVPLKVLLKL